MIGETYRIYGGHGLYADVKIMDSNDHLVFFQRLKDGRVVKVDKRNFERLRKERLVTVE